MKSLLWYCSTRHSNIHCSGKRVAEPVVSTRPESSHGQCELLFVGVVIDEKHSGVLSVLADHFTFFSFFFFEIQGFRKNSIRKACTV